MQGKHKHRSRLSKLIRWALLIFVLCIAYDAIIYEPRHPVLTTHQVYLPGLPKELDGLRVVQISDLHRRSMMPDSVIRQAVDMANAASPDIVVLTGDYVGRDASRTRGRDAADAEPCMRMLSKLRAKYGRYAILGNHDYRHGGTAVIRSLKRHHFTLLINQNTQPHKGLYLIGIDDIWEGKPDVEKAYRSVDERKPCIVLYHNPITAERLLQDKHSLALTGHTHGGQIRLPFIHQFTVPVLGTWKDTSGWYRRGGLLVYENRGIGMVSPVVRFRCRPEVAVFVLHGGKKLIRNSN